MEKEYCGIDFGTTNTTLVFFSEKYGKKFVGDKGNFIGQPLPSIIALNNTDNKVYVGHQVKQNIKQLSETCNIVSSIKTVLDDEILYWKFNGKENSPIDIAAYIFHSLQQNAKEQGIEKGAEERERDIAKSLLKDGISIPKVSMYTGLSEKQIAMLM